MLSGGGAAVSKIASRTSCCASGSLSACECRSSRRMFKMMPSNDWFAISFLQPEPDRPAAAAVSHLPERDIAAERVAAAPQAIAECRPACRCCDSRRGPWRSSSSSSRRTNSRRSRSHVRGRLHDLVGNPLRFPVIVAHARTRRRESSAPAPRSDRCPRWCPCQLSP